VGTHSKPGSALKEEQKKFEKQFLLDAIAQNMGNMTQAARQIGLSRKGLYDLLRKHNLHFSRRNSAKTPGPTISASLGSESAILTNEDSDLSEFSPNEPEK
jgi:hypothetical protein